MNWPEACVRVLVVSEQAVERLRATTALHLREDVEVVEAASATEATDRVRAGGFDVIVMDGDLSPEGGFSLLYELRAHGQLTGEPTPPALVMIAREQDRWLGGWAGANEVMIKPVDPFRIAAAVSALVGEPAARPVQQPESRADVAAALDPRAEVTPP